jgi:transposase
VAHAYLREAINGPGLHRRLADLFNRPEPTIKDWIKAARDRGYLSPAVPGRRPRPAPHSARGRLTYTTLSPSCGTC